MASRILLMGNPMLRQVAQVAPPMEALSVAKDLFEMLQKDHSWAISAPQIGIDSRVFVMARPKIKGEQLPVMGDAFIPEGIDKPTQYTAVVNPVITKVSEEMETDYEACKSVPGLVALVARHKWINVEFSTVDDQLRNCRLVGHPARIFQHEYDHLEGILYLDRVFDTCDIYMDNELARQINEGTFRKNIIRTSGLFSDSWFEKYYE